MRIEIINPYRSRNQYQADLEINGRLIGRVERGLSTGYHGSDYCVRVGGAKVAMGRTLALLREELKDPDIQNEILDLLAVDHQ